MCDKCECCQLILEIYPETYRYFETVNPQNIDLASLLSCLELYLAPVYEAIKKEKVFCCQGIVDAINKTVRTYIKSDPEDAGNFYATMNQILIQAGFSIPTNTVIIRKTLTPPDDSGRFIYFLNDKQVGPANGISGGESISLKDLPLGSYSIQEAGAPGTNINDYIVKNSVNSEPVRAGLTANFVLNCGLDTVCDFFNEKGGIPPCPDLKYYAGYIDLPITGTSGNTWLAFDNKVGKVEDCAGKKIDAPANQSLLWETPPLSNQVQYELQENNSQLKISMIVVGAIVQIVQVPSNGQACIKTTYDLSPVNSFTAAISGINRIYLWYYTCQSSN